MKCPRCQHENRPGAKFCEECATPLARTCSNCGSQLSATAKFCPECAHPVAGPAPPEARFASPQSYTPKHLAEKILTSKSALEGERKQVTVLFADLKGSMELLADRDPEEARRILDPVLELMMEAVHRYEGTVNQVMGDGIMALFGAPLAHEDHAVRACYAALRMQESVKKYAEEMRRSHSAVVRIRVGLNSGEVVVRAIGSDLHVDYTAVGQTTHLAARMEQLADPGAIVITPDTLAVAEGYIEAKSLGPVLVKGLAEAVEVYEVTGAGAARTRLQAVARRGLTHFVGRDAELEQLRHAQQLAANGHGQIAALVGEAGVGKSRLVYEFTHSHRLHGWLTLESASVSYGKATSYLPVIDLLKGYFKIQDRDDLREIREKVTGKLLALDESLKPPLPALLALLDVPVDDPAWQTLEPGRRRQLTLDAVRGLLLREARAQPVLVIFEDLHWIDSETQALLDGLVEGLGSARLLLLVNYRPEYQHAWGSKTYYRQLRLDALPAGSAGKLLDALLGEDPGLIPLKQLFVKRGNPFFLEETVRTLVETKALAGEPGRYQLTQPVQAIQVPPTVQVMLAARIDRLLSEDKRLLQVASVVGKDVPFALLQAVAELPDDDLRRGLARLQAAEFLYETGLYPDPEHSFKHALTHEVTYGGLLQERRRDLHARILQAMGTLYADQLEEHIDQLAHHALRGQVWNKALTYLERAGTKALARSANRTAATYFEEALTALNHLPKSGQTKEQAIDLRFELRNALTPLGHVKRTLEHLREANALAEQLGDQRRLGRALAFATNCLYLLGDQKRAIEFGQRALAVAEQLDEFPLKIAAGMYLGRSHYSSGNFLKAIDILIPIMDSLTTERRAREYLGLGVLPAVFSRSYLVMSLAAIGRFAEGHRIGEEALDLARATNHPDTMLWAFRGLGQFYLEQGEAERAVNLLERALSLCRANDLPVYVPPVTSALGFAYAMAGRLAEALPLLERAAQEEGTRQQVINHAPVVLRLAEAYVLADRTEDAATSAARGLDLAQRWGDRAQEAHALRILGEIAMHRGAADHRQAADLYGQVLSLAESLAMRPLVAHCHLGLGKLYRRTGQREQAQEHLTTATTMYREMGMTYWLEKAEAELGVG